MITVEVALSRVIAGLAPTAAEMVSLAQARHRVLAEDCRARTDHPPVDVSRMDGYALRAADAAGPLAVIGQAAAGHGFDGMVMPGQAVRIFTGAPLPAGADCVVMQEECRQVDTLLSLETQPEPDQYVRRQGMDFRHGQVLLPVATLMSPRHVALAAAMNLPWLKVRRRPRVAIIATGDEIVLPGETLGPAQLPSSNSAGLAAMVEANGGEAVDLGIAADNRHALHGLIDAAQGCDLLVTSGGASVGDYDMVREVLGEQGLDLDFWKIAMRPGKPLMFGRLRHVPVLGLPGNPVAAMVTATLFLIPMLRALQGLPQIDATRPAQLAVAMPANDSRQDYVRASLRRQADGLAQATPLGRQDSAVLTGLAAADCLIVRPPHAAPAQAGDRVCVVMLDP